MLIGNGYVPGHAEFALGLLRAEPGGAGAVRGPVGGQTECHDEPLDVVPRWTCCTAPADPRATALLVRGRADRLAGRGRGRAGRRRVVELDGALVTPAFVDAHVHATDTGLALTGLDLSGGAVGGGAAGRRCRRSRRGCRPTRWCSGTAGTSRRWADPAAADGGGAGPGGGRPAGVPVAGVDPLGVGVAGVAGGVRRRRRGCRVTTRRAGCGGTRTTWCGRWRWVRSVAAQRRGGAAGGAAARGGAGDRGGARVRRAAARPTRRTSPACWRCRRAAGCRRCTATGVSWSAAAQGPGAGCGGCGR